MRERRSNIGRREREARGSTEGRERIGRKYRREIEGRETGRK